MSHEPERWDDSEYSERFVIDKRQRTYTEKGLLYNREVKMKNLDIAIKGWKKQVLNIEIALTDVEDVESLRKERDTLLRAMEDVESYADALTLLYEENGNPSKIDISEFFDQHLDLVRRIGLKIQEGKYEWKTRSSVYSSRMSSRVSRCSDKTRSKVEHYLSSLEHCDKYSKPDVTPASVFPTSSMQSNVVTHTIGTATQSVSIFSTSPMNIPSSRPIMSSQAAPVASRKPPGMSFTNPAPYGISYKTQDEEHLGYQPPPRNNSQQFSYFPQQRMYEQSQNNLIEDLAERMLATRVQPPEPPIFTGNPLEYPGWRSAFEILVENKNIPAAEKIHYLKRYVGGEARECIDGNFLFSTENSFIDAKRILEERYGNPFVLENAFRAKLENWPKIGRDGKAMRRFADFLQQCLTAANAIPSLSVLDDVRENQKMQAKLPDWTVTRWARVVNQHKQRQNKFPSFGTFVSFVKEEADVVCNPAIIKSARDVNPKKTTVLKSDANESSSKRTEGDANNSVPKPKPKWTCLLCKGSHHLDECRDFVKKPLEERLEYVKLERLCFACLGRKHQAKVCKYRKRCKKCNRLHPTSLHREFQQPKVTPTVKEDTTVIENNNTMTDHKKKESGKIGNTPEKTAQSHVSYYTGVAETTKSSMIVPVYVSFGEYSSNEQLVYALLDAQSDTTFVIEETCSYLNVTGPEVKLKLSTMSSTDKIITANKISSLYVRGYHEQTKIKLPPAYTRKEVPTNRSHIPTPEVAKQWPHLEKIANNLVPLLDVKVALLIGYNCTKALTPREVISTIEDAPYAQRTDLGWGIVGTSSLSDQDDITCHRVHTKFDPCIGKASIECVHTAKEMFLMDDSINSEVDMSLRLTDKYSYDDVQFMKTVGSKIYQEPDGHYNLPLPLKDSSIELPNNKSQAVNRLVQLKRRMLKDDKYKKDYTEFMNEIIAKGYAEEVSEESSVNNVWYIPHHGVYNPNKPKIRVVFDCSAKYDSVSLNDLLLSGPDLTNTLIGVLCRFRKETVALTCDIEKMFYQFRVHESQRDMLRFLWWKNGDVLQEPLTYRMTVHLFGATSSPGCSNFGLKQAASDGKYEFGEDAALFVSSNFYVDDGLTSVASVKEAMDLASQTTALCAQGGLRLHKFASNSREVLESIPVEDRATGLQNLEIQPENVIERTLGLQWNIESDSFQFRIVLKERPLTRRGVLSTVSQVYDPLGFIAPVILLGKQLLQEVCHKGFDWDVPLPNDIKNRWLCWKDALFKLQDLKIPRCVKPSNFGPLKSVQLHHFSDASTIGYGQCSYLRLLDIDDRIHCCLVMAKARVAPLKMTTIPRLELTAALLSVNMSTFLAKELQYDHIEEFYYTDSKVVLGYISNESKRFHVFVANRVQQIRDHTNPDQWYHVDSKENPADLASRGMSVKHFLKNDIWFQGPSFLWQTELPSHKMCPLEESSINDPEVKCTFSTQTTEESNILPQLIQRFSSWHKAKTVIAYCRRYVLNLRRKVKGEDIYSKRELTVEELQQAELVILRAVQKAAFSVEIESMCSSKENSTANLQKKNVLYKLCPYMDECDILRVGGRLGGSSLPMEEKHPIILPRRGHVTQLIIRKCHEDVQHQGRGMTVNCVRSTGYWIISLNSVVRYYILKCVICRRWRSKTENQKMADLPEDRTECVPPFTYCGVDYFGPFTIRQKRSDVLRYGVLFTCLCSRAIHLEIAPSLETDSFINALRRFIAIRGPIRILRSDRGTNFIGAKNEFKQNLDLMNDDQVKQFLLQNGVDFEFRMNFPSSSHMGGVWERQIRTVRSVLIPILERCGSQLDDDSLRTVFYEVMSIVNSRPLTTDMLNDQTSANPLTPNHLLTMKSKIVLPPPGEFQEADIYSRKRWRRVQYLLNVFWSRWRIEYLQTLQPRGKWRNSTRNLCVGDVVIVKDENLVRNHWELAIVDEVFPSTDGCVRKVKLRLSDRSIDKEGRRTKVVRYLERPIHKLVVLLEAINDD